MLFSWLSGPSQTSAALLGVLRFTRIIYLHIGYTVTLTDTIANSVHDSCPLQLTSINVRPSLAGTV